MDTSFGRLITDRAYRLFPVAVCLLTHQCAFEAGFWGSIRLMLRHHTSASDAGYDSEQAALRIACREIASVLRAGESK